MALISIIVVATVAASLVFAMSTVKANTSSSNIASDVESPSSSVNATNNGGLFNNNGYMGFGGSGGPGGSERMGRGFFGDRGFGGNCSDINMSGKFGSIQVSSDYTQNVTNILNNDTDVQNLFTQGFNVTSIRPLITSMIDGNGNIITQATTADVILQSTTGRALVVVDLTSASVTKIVTTTTTVINK